MIDEIVTTVVTPPPTPVTLVPQMGVAVDEGRQAVIEFLKEIPDKAENKHHRDIE